MPDDSRMFLSVTSLQTKFLYEKYSLLIVSISHDRYADIIHNYCNVLCSDTARQLYM